jgi:hypothetical protein
MEPSPARIAASEPGSSEMWAQATRPRSKMMRADAMLGAHDHVAAAALAGLGDRPAQVDAGAGRADQAFGDPQAGQHLLGLIGLGDEVVGAGLKAEGDVALFVAGAEDGDIRVFVGRAHADPPAQLDAVDLRHHPVEEHDPRGVGRLQELPGLVPVAGEQAFKARRADEGLHYGGREWVIVGDEDTHWRMVPRCRGRDNVHQVFSSGREGAWRPRARRGL